MSFLTLKMTAGFALLLLSGAASAVGYCGAGTADPGLVVGNMTITDANNVVKNASDCYGHFAQTGPQSGAATATFVSGLNWGSPWSFVTKIDADGSNLESGSTNAALIYQGLSFSLGTPTYNSTTHLGTFTLSVTDTNGPTALNLPTLIDLVGEVKGGNGQDFFYFNDIAIDGANPGTFKLTYAQNTQINDLSHITFMARDGRDVDCTVTPDAPGCNPERVPEPASLALVAMALVGATAARRQVRKARA